MIHISEGHEETTKKCVEETLKIFPQFLPDKCFFEIWSETNCLKMHSASPVPVGGFDVHWQYPFDDINNRRGTIGCFFQALDGTMHAATCYHVVDNADDSIFSVTFKTIVDGVEKEFSREIGLHKFDGTVPVDIALLPVMESCDAFHFEHDECKVYDGEISELNRKEVQKNGATTGLTKGKITCDNYSCEMGETWYDNIVLVASSTSAPFSEGGDSGSIVTLCREGGETTHKAVSMLFAGGLKVRGISFSATFPLHKAMELLNIHTNYVILRELGSNTHDNNEGNSKNVKYFVSTSLVS